MLAGVVLVLAVSLFRLLPMLMSVGVTQPEWLPNFSPMAALCLCSAACLPRRWAIALPFIALLGTDFLLNLHYTNMQIEAAATAGMVPARDFSFWSVELFGKTLAFAAIAFFGWQLRRQTSGRVLLPAAIGSSLFFYLVTNTASWITDPAYGSNLSSWAQALTTGLPQYRPTWEFYRNTFVSDVLFTFLFLTCIRMRPSAARAPHPVAAW